MDALIEELPSARQPEIHPPLPLVPGTASVTIPTPDKEHVADGALARQNMGPTNRRVVAMVEPDFHDPAMVASRLDDGPSLGGVGAHRFLAEDVLARAHGGNGDGGERVVRGRDDDRLHLRVLEDLLPVASRGRPRDARHLFGTANLRIGNDHDRAPAGFRGDLCPSSSHRAAAYDPDTDRPHYHAHFILRSAGTMRRNV